MKTDFRVGDLVDVIDRRDGAVVARSTRIEKIEEASEQDRAVGLRGDYATVAEGFAVSVRCLRAAKTESRPC